MNDLISNIISQQYFVMKKMQLQRTNKQGIQTKIGQIYQVRNMNGKKELYSIKSISQNIVQKIEQQLQYYRQIFTSIYDDNFNFQYKQYFLQIKQTTIDDDQILLLRDQYKYTLQDAIKKAPFPLIKAKSIFHDITKAVYSLYASGFWSKMYRPQHFVYSKGIWKLQSVVFSHDQVPGIQCELNWKREYQPPQFYKPNFKFDDQNQGSLLVWSLGSLLLDMLAGCHVLSNKKILKKFEGQAFNIQVIDEPIRQRMQLSQEVRNVLSEMLHWDPKKRMTIQKLFTMGFLSKQVEQRYRQRIINKISKINENKQFNELVQSSQGILVDDQLLFQSIGLESNVKVIKKPQLKKMQSEQFGGYHQLEERKRSNQKEQKYKSRNEYTQGKNENMKSSNEEIKERSFRKKSNGSQGKVLQKPPSLKNMSQIKQAFTIYKSYLDRGEMLFISIAIIRKTLSNTIDKTYLECMLYAIAFCGIMNHWNLLQSMNKDRNCFNLPPLLWKKFYESKEYVTGKKLMEAKIQDRLPEYQELRQIVRKNVNPHTFQTKQIWEFIQLDYKGQTFQKIKMPYRLLLKQGYDVLRTRYNKDKTIQNIRSTTYLTFCLTIDKLYIPNKITKNFRRFFMWMNTQPSQNVPLRKFQQFIQKADVHELSLFCQQTISTYFEK